MKHLDRILISNVRRFKENVEISLGRGATVFLAPNGTGKTAIFEAIELALTGSVRRLPSPPTALIRDTKEKSFIRLDFDSGKFCEADFEKGKIPILAGHHSELFGGIPMSDVPYLLRLTHLLNQRNQEWLVQNNSDEAGDQLNHLSIGREASHANNLMASAKRTSKALVEQQERKLADLQDQLKKWTQLIENRKINQANFQNTLTPLASIYQRLIALCKPLNIVPPTLQDVTILVETLNIAKDIFDRSIERIRKRLLTLDTFETLVKDFINANNALQGAMQSVDKNKEAKVKIATQIAELQNRFLSSSTLINTLENELQRLRSLEATKSQRNEVALQIQRSQVLIESKLSERDKTLAEIQANEKQITDAEGIEKLHSIVSALEAESLKIDSGIKQKNVLISLWEEKQLTLDRSKQQLELIISNHNQLKSEVEAARMTLSSQAIELEKAQKAFDSVNATTDSIKGAIGIIANSISIESKECPVCLHHYEDGELQKKVEQALNSINPLLNETSKALEIERTKHAEASEYFSKSNNNLKTVDADKVRLESIIKALENDITNNISSVVGALSVSEAKIKLEGDAIKLNELSKQLEERKAESKTKPLVLVKPLRDALETLRSSLIELENSISKSQNEIATKRQELASFDETLKLSAEAASDIIPLILSQEASISKAKDEIELIRKEQENFQRILNQTNDILQSEEQNFNRLTSRLADLRSRWRSEQFDGDPNSETLKIAKQKGLDEQKAEQNLAVEIAALEEELQRWNATEVLRVVDKEINDLIGNISESEYEGTLTNSIREQQIKVADLKEKNSILNNLSSNLTDQLANVNKQIDSINPFWNKLLKRIVLEPRFAGTTLNSYTHYKKQKADVNVPLHNEQFTASHIASEAQITDLQFTFLLSMARQYSWSPWKALLLDDPTQHHDLVHASAVFDLLRDYIAELDFQVLLATHDSVQANFLVRKLENDGIATRLWRLKPTKGGVDVVAG